MAAARDLPDGAQYRNRVDTGMVCKALVLGRDQHVAVEGIDLLNTNRQPPFAVGAQETA